jgi:hypothetical protein
MTAGERTSAPIAQFARATVVLIARQLANVCKNVCRWPGGGNNGSCEQLTASRAVPVVRWRGTRERGRKSDRQKKSGLVAPQPAKRGVFGQLRRRDRDVDAKQAHLSVRRARRCNAHASEKLGRHGSCSSLLMAAERSLTCIDFHQRALPAVTGTLTPTGYTTVSGGKTKSCDRPGRVFIRSRRHFRIARNRGQSLEFVGQTTILRLRDRARSAGFVACKSYST